MGYYQAVRICGRRKAAMRWWASHEHIHSCLCKLSVSQLKACGKSYPDEGIEVVGILQEC